MISLQDLIAMAVAYIYVFACIGLGGWLRSSGKISAKYSRNFIHMLTGNAFWIWPICEHYWVTPIVAFSMFLLILAVRPKGRTSKTFESMARDRDYKYGLLLGPLLYILMITLIVGYYSLTTPERFYIGAAAIMVLMWGDGSAALIGSSIGKRRYRVFGSERSIEGSTAMFLASFAASLIALYYYGVIWVQVISDFSGILSLAFASAVTATFVEAISPRDIDNILVPLSVLVVLHMLT